MAYKQVQRFLDCVIIKIIEKILGWVFDLTTFEERKPKKLFKLEKKLILSEFVFA